MRFAAACLLLTLPASAADREFRSVVDAISNEFHSHPLHIPMFGLVNAVAFVVRPAGAKHIDLAVFEDLDTRGSDGRALAATIRGAVGGSWKPFVQTRSDREVVSVYMRPEGNDWRLLVVSIERHEATVVQLQLNPDGLQRWLTFPRESVMTRLGTSKSRDRDLDP